MKRDLFLQLIHFANTGTTQHNIHARTNLEDGFSFSEPPVTDAEFEELCLIVDSFSQYLKQRIHHQKTQIKKEIDSLTDI